MISGVRKNGFRKPPICELCSSHRDVQLTSRTPAELKREPKFGGRLENVYPERQKKAFPK